MQLMREILSFDLAALLVHVSATFASSAGAAGSVVEPGDKLFGCVTAVAWLLTTKKRQPDGAEQPSELQASTCHIKSKPRVKLLALAELVEEGMTTITLPDCLASLTLKSVAGCPLGVQRISTVLDSGPPGDGAG